jgi:alkylresorcinol/alkylpyrone synthase
VMVGDDHPKAAGPRVVSTLSAIYPDTREVIGFNVGGSGFEIVLTPGVAQVIEENFPADVAAFLSARQLGIDDIDWWVAHPGGPKVLEAFVTALGVDPSAFDRSWACLDRVGNLSSAAVLHVLADTLALGSFKTGAPGLLFALGPGVSAEFVLLEWAA